MALNSADLLFQPIKCKYHTPTNIYVSTCMSLHVYSVLGRVAAGPKRGMPCAGIGRTGMLTKVTVTTLLSPLKNDRAVSTLVLFGSMTSGVG